MDKKSQWADEVLNSLDGIKSAKPNNDLFAKIQAQLPIKREVKVIPLQRLRWIAVASCLIIAVNIYVFTGELKANTTEVAQTTTNNELLTNYSFYN